MAEHVAAVDFDGDVLQSAFDAEDDVISFLSCRGSAPVKDDIMGRFVIQCHLNASLGEVVNPADDVH